MEIKVEKINGFDFRYWLYNRANRHMDSLTEVAFDILDRIKLNIDQIIYIYEIDDFINKTIDDLIIAFKEFKNMNDDKIIIYRKSIVYNNRPYSFKNKIISYTIEKYLLEGPSIMSILKNMNCYCNFEYSDIYIFKTQVSKRFCSFLDLVEYVRDFKAKTGVDLSLDYLTEQIFSDTTNDLIFDKRYLEN